MRIPLLFAIGAICISLVADPVALRSSGLNEFTVYLQTDPKNVTLTKVETGGAVYTKIASQEGLNEGFEGTPDIPRFRRWLAVDPSKNYRLKVEMSDPIDYEDVLLWPVQPDRLEATEPAAFELDSVVYSQDVWWGGKGGLQGEKAKLGNVTVLPVTLMPFHYNPLRKKLRLYRNISINLMADTRTKGSYLKRGEILTPFVVGQASQLVLNVGDLLTRHVPRDILGVHVILAPADLMPYAKAIGALQHPMSVNVRYEEMPGGMTSILLRKWLVDKYPGGQLNSVLLFGDESRIPLHDWSASTPGDWYYTLVEGTDNIADIGVGRLPVSDAREAELIVKNTKAYYALAGSGHTNKKVLLVAHKEDYPEKYTANQEKIRKSPNPRNLKFTTRYGGDGALNSDVIREAETGFSIINYRGHGSVTSWSGWAKDGFSFGFPEVEKLKLVGEKQAIVFNIACDNGAIQNAKESLAEKMLFPAAEEAGAVAVLAATQPSLTEMNHRFDLHLFKYLQEGESLSLGEVVAYANNKLVQENDGAMPTNVKMYLLLADPLLSPWIQ